MRGFFKKIVNKIIKEAEIEAVEKIRNMDYPKKNIKKFLLLIPIADKLTNISNKSDLKQLNN